MYRRVLIGATLLFVLCLIAGSLYPDRSALPLAARLHNLGIVVGTLSAAPTAAHRLLHFVSFGALSLLLVAIATTRKQVAYSILATVLLAIGIEYGQHRVFTTPVEWGDVRDDSFASMGIFLVSQVGREWAHRVSVRKADRLSQFEGVQCPERH